MTSYPPTCLAFDFGAGSGRAILARFDGATIRMQELLRFPSTERADPDGLHWDAAVLFEQVERGLQEAAPYKIASIGVDSWGLDYGLLDKDGALLADPHHYRDDHSRRGYERSAFEENWLAQVTGAQVLPVNTLFQLIEDRATDSEILNRARRMLMMADLVNHHLTGLACNELTLARTSGMHSWSRQGWSGEILSAAGIPARLLSPPVLPGTILGPLRPDLAKRSGIDGALVVAVAGHDTASAVSALPLDEGDAFLIAGTWNLIGFEAQDVPPSPFHEGFGIEGGAEGRALVTRSLDGMLLIRRLQADLSRLQGRKLAFADLQQMAQRALLRKPAPTLDTSDPALLHEGFVEAVRRQLGGGSDDDTLVLALYLGLADKVADGLDRIARIRGVPPKALRLGGGGAQDAFFCELLAARTGLPVIAGPVEASAVGNALFQFIGLGAVEGLAAARRFVARSDLLKEYRPDPNLAAKLERHHART